MDKPRWNWKKRCHERFADLSRDGAFEEWECIPEKEEAALAKRREEEEQSAQRLREAHRKALSGQYRTEEEEQYRKAYIRGYTDGLKRRKPLYSTPKREGE